MSLRSSTEVGSVLSNMESTQAGVYNFTNSSDLENEQGYGSAEIEVVYVHPEDIVLVLLQEGTASASGETLKFNASDLHNLPEELRYRTESADLQLSVEGVFLEELLGAGFIALVPPKGHELVIQTKGAYPVIKQAIFTDWDNVSDVPIKKDRQVGLDIL